MKFGSQGVYLENPRAQIVFRGTMDDVNTALLKAQTAFEALAQSNVTLGSTLFYRIAPMQSPYLRGYSAHGGPEVAFMIEAQKEVF